METAPLPIGGRRPGDVAQRLPAADVLELQLEGGNKLIVRPSGTEPKVKAYAFAKADAGDAADQLLAQLQDAARGLLS